MAGRTDTSLAKIMGAIIKQQRQKKYPGHGGQMKCAADFGVSQPEWSRWENGQKTPSAANQRKIADFFGIYIGELWGEEKPTTTTKHEPNVKADRETVFLETDEASPSNEKIIYAERIERGEFDRIVNEVVKNAGDDTPAKCFPLLLKRLSPPLWPSNVSIYPVFRFIEASLWRLFLLTRKEAIADSTARILIKKERFSFLVEKLRVIPWPCNQHYYIEIVPAVFEEFIYRLKGKKCPLDIALSFFYLGFIAHAENALRALELEETQNEAFVSPRTFKLPEEFSQELELAPPSEPLPYDLHNLRRLTLLNIEMQETVNRGFKLLEEGKINYDSLKKIYVEAIHRLREAFGEHLEMMEETSENDSSP